MAVNNIDCCNGTDREHSKVMCGRYTLYEIDEVGARFEVEVPDDLKPNYNAAPTQVMPVITKDGLQIMRWGLIPAWAKDEKIGYKMINARAETIFEKPMWKGIVKKNRCLIPANGFYEWKKVSDGKQPYYIHLPDEKLFAFAGIWEAWKHDGVEWHTYSIITTSPNGEMENIHDRMPVILEEEEEQDWLFADDQSTYEKFLNPLPDNSLRMHEVSKDVNVVKINRKELIGPVNSQ